MPAALTDGCDERHWRAARSAHAEAIALAGFEPRLLSRADEARPLEQHIVHELYRVDVLVCDVSGQNPNVMLGLGMRLAFDRPALVVQDDETVYSFEGVPLDHLTYPRDLQRAQLLDFKLALTRKLAALRVAEAASRPSFLEHCAALGSAQQRARETPDDAARREQLGELKAMVQLMQQDPRALAAQNAGRAGHTIAKAMEFVAQYLARHGIAPAQLERREPALLQALEQRLFPRANLDGREEWTDFCDVLLATVAARPSLDATLRFPPRAPAPRLLREEAGCAAPDAGRASKLPRDGRT